MRSWIQKHFTYANVMASIAVFIALGAGAYAAGLAPNSVKSKTIKDGQVKTPDIGFDAVNSSHLSDNSVNTDAVSSDSLTGDDIDEFTLGLVPNASEANEAQNSGLLDNKDSSEFQEVGSEGWTNLPLNDAGAPVACTWVPFNGGFATPSYFRDGDG